MTDENDRSNPWLLIWTTHALSNGCQDLGGGRYLKYRPPGRHLVHRPPLVVAATPPPLRAVACRSAAAPACQYGMISRVLLLYRFAATSTLRETRASRGRGHQLPVAGRATTSSATPTWFFWKSLHSPLAAPTWRISSCAMPARCGPPPAMGAQSAQTGRPHPASASCTGSAMTESTRLFPA